MSDIQSDKQRLDRLQKYINKIESQHAKILKDAQLGNFEAFTEDDIRTR